MLVDGDAYTGYVSVGTPVSEPYDSTTAPLAYVRPHPTHSGKYILSQLWTVADQPLFPVSASIRQTVRGSYTLDMEAMTCTSSFFFTSFGKVTKLLPTPYVFMISPRVVDKNDLVRARPLSMDPNACPSIGAHVSTWTGPASCSRNTPWTWCFFCPAAKSYFSYSAIIHPSSFSSLARFLSG